MGGSAATGSAAAGAAGAAGAADKPGRKGVVLIAEDDSSDDDDAAAAAEQSGFQTTATVASVPLFARRRGASLGMNGAPPQPVQTEADPSLSPTAEAASDVPPPPPPKPADGDKPLFMTAARTLAKRAAAGTLFTGRALLEAKKTGGDGSGGGGEDGGGGAADEEDDLPIPAAALPPPPVPTGATVAGTATKTPRQSLMDTKATSVNDSKSVGSGEMSGAATATAAASEDPTSSDEEDYFKLLAHEVDSDLESSTTVAPPPTPVTPSPAPTPTPIAAPTAGAAAAGDVPPPPPADSKSPPPLKRTVTTIKQRRRDTPGPTVSGEAPFRQKPSDESAVHQILPGLYLSGQSGAVRNELLKSLGVKAIVNVTSEVGNMWEDEFTYKTIEISDDEDENLKQHFRSCNEFIHSIRTGAHPGGGANGAAATKSAAAAASAGVGGSATAAPASSPPVPAGGVLVHCMAGMSRSATVVISYLMWAERMSLWDSYWHVKRRRHRASPNEGFMKQLASYERQLVRRSHFHKKPTAAGGGGGGGGGAAAATPQTAQSQSAGGAAGAAVLNSLCPRRYWKHRFDAEFSPAWSDKPYSTTSS